MANRPRRLSNRPFVNACSVISTALLLGLACIYFVTPVDFIPEALVGPVGYIDDLVFSGVALLPVAKRLRGALPGRRRRTGNESGASSKIS